MRRVPNSFHHPGFFLCEDLSPFLYRVCISCLEKFPPHRLYWKGRAKGSWTLKLFTCHYLCLISFCQLNYRITLMFSPFWNRCSLSEFYDHISSLLERACTTLLLTQSNHFSAKFSIRRFNSTFPHIRKITRNDVIINVSRDPAYRYYSIVKIWIGKVGSN